VCQESFKRRVEKARKPEKEWSKMSVIKSVGFSDEEILNSILSLYVPSGRFDLDPTYSRGNFYNKTNILHPVHKSDLNPESPEIMEFDCRKLPHLANSIKTIVFDPPFMFGTHGQTKNNIMNKRFTMFHSFGELEQMYKESLWEFHSILIPNGYLFFKCQYYTDSKTTMTHCFVWQWAQEAGFYAQDLFVMVTKNGRIYNPNLVQRHARKFHSYWFVFNKI
jgi:hypothetical protein